MVSRAGAEGPESGRDAGREVFGWNGPWIELSLGSSRRTGAVDSALQRDKERAGRKLCPFLIVSGRCRFPAADEPAPAGILSIVSRIRIKPARQMD